MSTPTPISLAPCNHCGHALRFHRQGMCDWAPCGCPRYEKWSPAEVSRLLATQSDLDSLVDSFGRLAGRVEKLERLTVTHYLSAEVRNKLLAAMNWEDDEEQPGDENLVRLVCLRLGTIG